MFFWLLGIGYGPNRPGVPSPRVQGTMTQNVSCLKPRHIKNVFGLSFTLCRPNLNTLSFFASLILFLFFFHSPYDHHQLSFTSLWQYFNFLSLSVRCLLRLVLGLLMVLFCFNLRKADSFCNHRLKWQHQGHP